MIIVDTSVWVDFLDGTENFQTDYLSKSLELETPLFSTGLILQEILQGLAQQKTTEYYQERIWQVVVNSSNT